MDWVEDVNTDLWAFPAGMERSGAPEGRDPLKWMSKYGSVVASGYDMSVRLALLHYFFLRGWVG